MMAMNQHLIRSPITYVFALHLKARDHTNSIFIYFLCYVLCMDFKCRQNFMVTDLGCIVKWAISYVLSHVLGHEQLYHKVTKASAPMMNHDPYNGF